MSLLLSSVLIPAYAQSDLNLDDTPKILPDNPYYGFKRLGEVFDMVFTFNDTDRAVKQVKISEERLKEIKAMADKGKTDLIPDLQEDYKKSIDEAVKATERLPNDNNGQLVKAFVSEKLQEHPEKLGLLVSQFTQSLQTDSHTDTEQEKETEDLLKSIEDVAKSKKDAYQPEIEKSRK
jgi:phage-related tail protein